MSSTSAAPAPSTPAGSSRQGHGALHSAGGDEDLPRLHDVARPLMADIGPARGKVPDVRPAQEGGGGLAEFADEGFAARVIGPDLLAFVGGGGTGAAEDLASGLGLPVKDEDGKPVPRGLQRRAHARGPAPIMTISHCVRITCSPLS